ncbi:hypothetical protein IJG66_01865 [Candidatus Saccharibacteria bacterium]|nr:hypothetical protein [Candidatus Saccharibacteria bacterium]
MKYLAVLGRQPEISCAELSAQFGQVQVSGRKVAVFEANTPPEIDRLGGSLKIAEEIAGEPLDFLLNLPEGKITLGISDYSAKTNAKTATKIAIKLKNSLKKSKRSVRILPNSSAEISTAAALHNGLGRKKNHLELIIVNGKWYRVIGVQNIEAYAARDQARPARDARVGMLPPKLAQILINLCGPLQPEAVVLDPFCGTGVVLQEALLMGYRAYGTDVSERMTAYSRKNLQALSRSRPSGPSLRADGARPRPWPAESLDSAWRIFPADATSATWQQPIDAVACETYLGPPMSLPPAEIKLKEAKQECQTIILGFLKNLAGQIDAGTPVTIAVPAWLRPDGSYSRLNILDEIENLGYNVEKYSNLGDGGLLYHREGQVVAREIIVLRKK